MTYYPSVCLEGLRKTIKNFSYALEKEIKDEKMKKT
jgi:hypothetical protein